MSDGGHEMLRAAVNAAREFQCRSVHELRGRLQTAFPDRERDIEEAIRFWAESAAARRQ